MNVQTFTKYWNYARFIVIIFAFALLGCMKLCAFGGFAPNLEVDHFDRFEPDENKSDYQVQEERTQDSKSGDVPDHIDQNGTVHHFEDGKHTWDA